VEANLLTLKTKIFMGIRRVIGLSSVSFEHKNEKLISRREFGNRLLKYGLGAFILLVLSLLVGTVGYKYLAGLGWVDAFLNASMILTGMGPTSQLPNDASKIFASLYAIYSGVIFLSVMAIFFTPIAHRFLHKFHLDIEG
jgi:hypothetical protein